MEHLPLPDGLGIDIQTQDRQIRAQLLSRVQLFVTPWAVAHQVPLCMGFSMQDDGVGCHFLLHGIFMIQELNPCLLHFFLWQADPLLLSFVGSPER